MSSLIPPIKSAIQVLQQRLHQLEETGGVYSNITASLDTTYHHTQQLPAVE